MRVMPSAQDPMCRERGPSDSMPAMPYAAILHDVPHADWLSAAEKHGIRCDYTRQKRGRKRQQCVEAQTTGASPSIAPKIHPLQHRQQPSHHSEETPLFDPSNRTQSSNQQSTSSSSAVVRHVPQNLDVSHYLNPEIPRGEPNIPLGSRWHLGGTGTSASKGENREGDPITLHILSLSEAERLLNLFMRRLNPLLGMFDPYLHTLDYVRSTSSILLAALLAVSAKFFRRELQASLLNHAQMILQRATSVGECDIGIVKTLAIMAYWKAPTDRSSWVKLGTAIRLGFQLGLHIPRTEPLPEDDHEARIVADAERTWFCLSRFDRSYSDVFDLPSVLRPEHTGDCKLWAQETARLHVSDMQVVCSMDSASTYLVWTRYRSLRKTFQKDWCCTLLHDLYRQFDRHMKEWFPEHHDDPRFPANEKNLMQWFDLNHLLKIKNEMLNVCPAYEYPEVLNSCLDLARRFMEQTELLARDGSLPYLQDTSATHLSSIGIILHQLFWRFSDDRRGTVIEIVKRLHHVCVNVAEGDPDAVTGFVARFMQRLVQGISAENQTMSRAPTPDARGEGSIPPLTHGIMTDLDDFLRFTASQASDPAVDGQFWASLYGTNHLNTYNPFYKT